MGGFLFRRNMEIQVDMTDEWWLVDDHSVLYYITQEKFKAVN